MFKGFLKQSTATTVVIGHLINPSSDVTPVTTATLSAADDAVITKNGAATVDIASATFTAKTNADGCYNLSLTASHTDTLGRLDVIIRDDSAFKPVIHSYVVLSANVFDSLIGGSDYLQVDALQIDGNPTSAIVTGDDSDMLRTDVAAIDGNVTAAEKASTAARATESYTAQTASTTTLVKSNATESTNDHYNGRTLVFITGALAGQATAISDYDGSTKAFTVTALTEAPANGDIFVVV